MVQMTTIASQAWNKQHPSKLAHPAAAQLANLQIHICWPIGSRIQMFQTRGDSTSNRIQVENRVSSVISPHHSFVRRVMQENNLERIVQLFHKNGCKQ